MSLTLNQKLETVGLGEKEVPKAEPEACCA